GNAAELMVVCAWICRGARPALSAPVDFWRVVVGATAGAATIAAIGGAAIALSGDGTFGATFQAVLTSHLSAVLVLAPLGLRCRNPYRLAGAPELGAQLGLLIVCSWFGFLPEQSLPVGFVVFPLLVWAAMRFPLWITVVELAALGCFLVLHATHGRGLYVIAVEDAGLAPGVVATLVHLVLISVAVTVYMVGLSTAARDRAHAEVLASRLHLDAIISSANRTAIIQVDLDGTVQVFNEGASRMLGWRADEVVGTASPLIFHDPDEVATRAAELGVPAGLEAFVHRVRTREADAERRDWTFVARDGSRRLVAMVISRVEGADGAHVGYLGIAEDVTADREVATVLAEALEHQRALAERLREADQLKDDFVSSVSHELRTPMTSVLGYTEILQDSYADTLDADAQMLLGRIETNGRRMLDIVEDLLTLSRIQAGTWTMEERPFDLSLSVRRGAGVPAPQADARRVHVTVAVPDRPVPVVGDAREMERVVTNLVGNAVKFTPDGGAVVASLTDSEQGPVLTVTDTGIGIPPEALPQLFDRFYRAPNAAAAGIPGTGLGLPIAKGVIERHRGTLTVESEAGVGTTFEVRLPRPA
ncbi:MAG: ATP-binding protein, partial [Nocardioides sp.]|nr:ATP-binding protein [Nocardioides sp.]